MSVMSEFKLNTGAVIPSVGLGDAAPRNMASCPGEVKEAVKHALKAGYRHIDCALIYQNEDEVGQGIKESGIPRSELFITSKLWNTYHDKAAESLEQSLKSLGTDYLDLFLIHWPCKVKAIGVSNWSIPYLEKLSKSWKIVPAVNQVELHPYNPQHDLKEYCDDKGILLEAYCPLGSTGAPLLKDEVILKIADKYNVSPATICISYQVNRGIVVLPKSVTAERIADNLKVIKLDDEDMKTLNDMAGLGKQKRVNTPKFGWDLGFHDWYGVGNKEAPDADAITAKN